MKERWLYGIVIVLSVALSGVCGYAIASENNPENSLNGNSYNSLTYPNTNLSSNNAGNNLNTISVTGIGTAEGKPNSVEMEVGVITEVSKDVGADEAVERNSSAINKVIESLKEKGISDEDIETSRFDLSIQREYVSYRERNEITGYRVVHMLSVKTSDVYSVGQLIDSAVDSGANEVGSIQFTFSEEKSDELEVLARERAAEDAKNKAEAIANSLGVEITGVSKVSEGYQPYPVYDELKRAESGSTSIVPPTSLKRTISLNVVFIIE